MQAILINGKANNKRGLLLRLWLISVAIKRSGYITSSDADGMDYFCGITPALP
jgi:hypothetical protein